MKSREAIYLEILAQGLLIIRGAAFQEDAAQCRIEADHLHNIPELLRAPGNEELHVYYWNVTRVGYIRQSNPDISRSYQTLWQQLKEATWIEKQLKLVD